MPRPEIIVEAPELRIAPERVCEPFAWEDLFGRSGPVEIEIGIGKGRFMLAAAESRPDVLMLGVEWANKYLRFAESRAAKRGMKNVRFLRIDARKMMPNVPDASVDAFYVFYPDPWPKKRHQKRRFLREDNAEAMARIIKPGGLLHVATDHVPYWTEIEPLFDKHPAYSRLPEFGGPGFPVPSDGALTNFEAKYEIEGRSRNRGSWRVQLT